jgi:hypothetical protein
MSILNETFLLDSPSTGIPQDGIMSVIIARLILFGNWGMIQVGIFPELVGLARHAISVTLTICGTGCVVIHNGAKATRTLNFHLAKVALYH